MASYGGLGSRESCRAPDCRTKYGCFSATITGYNLYTWTSASLHWQRRCSLTPKRSGKRARLGYWSGIFFWVSFFKHKVRRVFGGRNFASFGLAKQFCFVSIYGETASRSVNWRPRHARSPRGIDQDLRSSHCEVGRLGCNHRPLPYRKRTCSIWPKNYWRGRGSHQEFDLRQIAGQRS